MFLEGCSGQSFSDTIVRDSTYYIEPLRASGDESILTKLIAMLDDFTP